ncbi:MAG: hypothetical protein WC129_01635 [Sphaerochaetaceae bacterium]|jgi:hypothetical protein|nr:hypothetical protein [Sphaerochaetaceae bacterium]NLV83718.1 hypothetical protein [Spirochaetales bacterium]
MRKNRLVLIVIMLACMQLSFASYRTAGYGWSVEGTAFLLQPAYSSSSGALHILLTPFDFEFLEPAMFCEVRFGIRSGSPGYLNLTAGSEISLFRMINHPFGFLMPVNKTAYAPSFSIGARWESHDAEVPRLYMQLAWLRLLEKDAWYQWFSPFVTLDVRSGQIDSWGIQLWRFSYLVW